MNCLLLLSVYCPFSDRVEPLHNVHMFIFSIFPCFIRINQMRPLQPRIVPLGHHISSSSAKYGSFGNSTRRLEVLRNCIMFIFDNKISDARKVRLIFILMIYT